MASRKSVPPDRSPGGREVADRAWRVLRSDLVLDSPFMRVHRDWVRTPDGYEIPEYYLVDAPDIVVVLALTTDQQAILVEQYRHGVGQSVLELPAGMLDPSDPSPLAAARRELLEETGYQSARLESLGRLFPSTARQSNRTHCFLAFDGEQVGEPGGDPAESIAVRRLSLGELRAIAGRGEFPSQTSLGCLFLGLERLRELGLE